MTTQLKSKLTLDELIQKSTDDLQQKVNQTKKRICADAKELIKKFESNNSNKDGLNHIKCMYKC